MRRITIGLFFFICLPFLSMATHLRGGEITVRQLQCGSLKYEITLTIYINTASAINAGQGTLSFGDGLSLVVPKLSSILVDANFEIGKAVFRTTHQFAAPGSYTISYMEQNRNAGILSIQNSVQTPFYLAPEIMASLTVCNNPVTFEILPIDRACHGYSFTHNPGASDLDGDSISYELVAPEKNAGIPVDGYKTPNDITFYSGADYQKSNEAQDGPPTFQIDALSGTLTWDAPGEIGEYVIAIKISEWRKEDTTWINLGYVIRDMQILVEDCQNGKPVMGALADACVKPGDHLSVMVRGLDPDGDNVRIEVFTVDNFSSSPPTFVNQNQWQSTASPFDTANVKLEWNITCDLVRDQPYKIVFKITDQPANGFRLASFMTLNVSVVGPAPVYKTLTLDLAKKTMKIEWEPYPCTNASAMEIWRRVDEGPSVGGTCLRGIPRSWGFEKIGSVPLDTFYLDHDLNPGAKYCYRLVALFETPFRSQSIASLDTCIGPIIVDAPVVTNVSVDKTDLALGEVSVRWTSPFEISKVEFPPPYEYELFETEDSVHFTKVTSTRTTDTTYVVSSLNTKEKSYGYKVVVYSPNGIAHENPVDTSALAFYPRLRTEPKEKGIYLYWEALVPWSNQSQYFPWHYIYRKEEGTSFVLIDSINVNDLAIDRGFDYLDVGAFDHKPFQSNSIYTYKVEPQGTYGNPKIKEPLVNFSNEALGQPIDRTPPCKPFLTLDNKVSCDAFISNTPCDFLDYKNSLHWEYPDGCGNDVAYFKLFYFSSPPSDSTQIAATEDFSFLHRNLNSFSGCYKILAVDRAGNVGQTSDEVCNDNCPHVFIPNVFTPDNEDGINDSFPGFIKTSNQKADPVTCPRFVKSIDLTIFNRWGEEVYFINTASQQFSSEWSGRDSSGRELPAGIYFYKADINFNTMDPALQNQNSRGWVNLVR